MRLLPLLGIAALGLGAGMAEAISVVRLERELPIPDLDPRLHGLRIAHVSDLHLGAPGVNLRAARRAEALLAEAAPDLIAITGDQLSHERGAHQLLRFLRGLQAPLGVFAVLGNHDLGYVRDPFSKAGPVPDYASAGVQLLRDETVEVQRAGARIAISGIEPRRQEGPQVLPPHGPRRTPSSMSSSRTTRICSTSCRPAHVISCWPGTSTVVRSAFPGPRAGSGCRS